MTEQKVSFRYAKAVIESSEKEKLTEVLLKDFVFVKNTLLASQELRTFIKSPVVSEKNKKNIVNIIFTGKIDNSTLNFLLFLISKGRGNLIVDVINKYEEQYDILNNRIKVEIYTAIELTDEIKKMIIQKITDYTKKIVLPKFNVQQSLTGGIMVQVADWVFDASLKSQLEHLYFSLAKN